VELRTRPARGIAPSPSAPEKLWRIVSVQAPAGEDGGVSLNTMPQPAITRYEAGQAESDAALPALAVVP